MSTKTKKPAAEPSVAPELPEQPSTAEEVLNDPVFVEAFGRKYEIKRYNIGELIRALPYLSPIGYILVSAYNQPDNALLVSRIMSGAGEPAVGLISVAISEPSEWIEEQDDPIGALELLTAVVEKNARYFFEPENVERIRTAFAKLQSISQKHGGAISTP